MYLCVVDINICGEKNNYLFKIDIIQTDEIKVKK